jgi:hypothetical protein
MSGLNRNVGPGSAGIPIISSADFMWSGEKKKFASELS